MVNNRARALVRLSSYFIPSGMTAAVAALYAQPPSPAPAAAPPPLHALETNDRFAAPHLSGVRNKPHEERGFESSGSSELPFSQLCE